jgi:hypothetical protein
MNEERRKYRRTPKRIRLSFRKTKLMFMQGPRDSADAIDISSTGVRMNTRLDLSPGDRVRLLIRRADDDPELPFTGTVVWAKTMSEKGEAFTQAGVEFTRLGLKQRVLLVRLATGI